MFSLDRPVALKVMNPSILAHPDAVPRFEAEVRAAARLDHPQIVRAHDADRVGDLHLLVMEFIAPDAFIPPQFAGLLASIAGMLLGSLLPQHYGSAAPARVA